MGSVYNTLTVGICFGRRNIHIHQSATNAKNAYFWKAFRWNCQPAALGIFGKAAWIFEMNMDAWERKFFTKSIEYIPARHH